MLLYPQVTISCDGDGCDYEETIELTPINDDTFEVLREELESAGWKVINDADTFHASHYCGDCKED